MTTTPQISPERTRNQSLAFGRNLIVLALLILILGALTLRWPRANATIIDANLSTFTRDSSEVRTSDERPSFAVHYNYKVGGVDYFGGGVEPMISECRTRSALSACAIATPSDHRR
jgi:hypothetical protein